jgi:hypothetical protein
MSTLTVTTIASKGVGSLTYELSHASSGDTIVFSNTIAGDTIALPSVLDITGTNITIDGGSDNITLSGAGGGGHTVVEVATGASVTIDNLTIANGVGTGAASSDPVHNGGAAAGGIYDLGSLVLNSDLFLNDKGTGGAGADASLSGEGGGAGGIGVGGVYVATGASAVIEQTVTFKNDTGIGGHGGYGAGGTYYSGGSQYASAPTHYGAGGAGGVAKSSHFGYHAGPNATSQGFVQGGTGQFGAGAYGAQGGNTDQQGMSNTYMYEGGLAIAAGGGGGGGAAFADFGGNGSIACYLRGTRILTDRGSVAVEELDIGDALVTGSGDIMKIKWIGRRAYAGWAAEANDEVQPILFKAGSIADHVPSRDLYVSPEHAMYVDGILIPSRNLVNGISILRAQPMDEVSYFHIELDRHDVIFAEGALSETFIDDESRDTFHNVSEFHMLYPTAAVAPVEYCAPRVEDGYQLEAVRRSLLSRAIRLLPDGTAGEGRVLDANVDLVTRHVVEGWAYLPDEPQTRVRLAVIDNGVVIGRVVADRHRADLEKAGIGDGCHSFSFLIPAGLSESCRHEIEVRRESDWTLVAGSPVTIAAEVLEIVPAYESTEDSESRPVLLV